MSKPCFATLNRFIGSQGGEIIVGIENNKSEPPALQKISQNEVNRVVSRLRSLTDGVAIANPAVVKHENGGEYFKFKILPSMRIIATTSSGKVFVRISDNCYPIRSEELTNLASEKGAFQWELITALKLHERWHLIRFLNSVDKLNHICA